MMQQNQITSGDMHGKLQTAISCKQQTQMSTKILELNLYSVPGSIKILHT